MYHSYRIYIPHVYSDMQDATQEVANVARRMAEVYGGSTEYQAIGRYIMQEGPTKGACVVEDVSVIESLTDADNPKAREFMRVLARNAAVKLDQESVMIQFDGQAEFITQDWRKQAG